MNKQDNRQMLLKDLLCLASIGLNMPDVLCQPSQQATSRKSHKIIPGSRQEVQQQQQQQQQHHQHQPRPLDLSIKRGLSKSLDINNNNSHNHNKSKLNKSIGQDIHPKYASSVSKIHITSSTSPASSSTGSSWAGSISSASSPNTSSNDANPGLVGTANELVPNSIQDVIIPSTDHKNAHTASDTQQAGRQKKKVKGADRSHMCQHCGRLFSRSDMLTRHSRVHSGSKPYQCSECKQGFSRSDHLSTHERIHTGEKPYQCDLCAYSACRRDMITRHMRIHGIRTRTAAPRQRPRTIPTPLPASLIDT